MNFSISLAETATQIRDCFPVMVQLRPHLEEEAFVAQVQRQMQMGYRLAAVQVGETVVAVAGFRVTENLCNGRFLYVDDLVTDQGGRSHGYGSALMQWLTSYAQEQHCNYLMLDSGVQRFDAHRFYFRERLHIAGYHFSRPLSE